MSERRDIGGLPDFDEDVFREASKELIERVERGSRSPLDRALRVLSGSLDALNEELKIWRTGGISGPGESE